MSDGPLGEVGKQIRGHYRESILRGSVIHSLLPRTEAGKERARAFIARRAELVPEFRAALALLDTYARTSTDVGAAVLNLHTRSDSRHMPQCMGCEFSGFDAEPPDWPCQTVDVVANHLGFNWPNWRMCDWSALNEEKPA